MFSLLQPFTTHLFYIRFHPLTIQWMLFAVFVYPKHNIQRFITNHLEVKPLPQSKSIRILSHKQPILSLVYPQCTLKVTTLKFTVELKVRLKCYFQCFLCNFRLCAFFITSFLHWRLFIIKNELWGVWPL